MPKPSKLLTVASALAVCAPLAALAGIDSVRLDPVPIDARVDCDRVFFQSSQRLPGTIFVMPRVAIGVRNDSALFAIEPTKDGRYKLHVGVWFPRDDERVKVRFNRAMPETSRCSFASVQYFLNKRTSSPPVETIARMPLTSIEVSIPGVGKPYVIGRYSDSGEDVDILSYFGASYTAYFYLTEEEKDEVQSRLSHAQGLEFNVTFRFQARRVDGSISAEIDWRSLAASLDAHAAGQRLVTRGTFSSMVRAALSDSHVKISREEGSSEAYAKIADRITDLVLSEKAPEAKEEGAPNADVSEDPKEGASTIDLKAAVRALSQRTTKSFAYEQVGRPETATAATTVAIQTRITDPNTREVEAVAGEADPTLPGVLKAGQSISLTPAYTSTTEIELKERKTFLTVEQIAELDLSAQFEDLQSGKMVLENREINGRLVAEGKWNLTNSEDPFFHVYTPARYQWERTERVPTEVNGKPVRIYRNGVRREALNEVPVSVTFSALGRRLYTLNELASETDSWSGRFTESGAIVLTAKHDLGLVSLREHYEEGRDYEAVPVVFDEVVQVERSPFAGPKRSAPVALQTNHRTKMKSRSIVLYVSRTPGE